jgi:tight adherence protein C
MGIGYGVFAFIAVFVVTAGVALLLLWFDPVYRRLREMGEATGETEISVRRWADPAAPVRQWRRTLQKLGQGLLSRVPDTHGVRHSTLRGRLIWAGYDDPRSVPMFLGTKVIMAFGLAYSYTVYGLAVHRVLPNILLVSLILGVIGFFLPDFWLSQRIKERKRLITNALPDVLDLLVVCVEAGMGLDAAIARVTDPDVIPVSTPLHREMRRMHLEFRAGRPRTESLHALGVRTGVDDVRKIVAAFIQTEKLGTSLADTLRIHAEASRVARRLRAEKAAQLAPLKMLFPIVFFLFPAFVIVMLLPPILKIKEFFIGP